MCYPIGMVSVPPAAAQRFRRQVLRWFDQHGRKHLPWQKQPSPYRVWISEIMLQQTQVATVIPYYQTFMRHFPSVSALARADEDHVLQLWSGLGYYARARNLHRAAKIIANEYRSCFPREREALIALPGIGRSTAGAISALALHQRAPILDGNVKRVLTRFHAIAGWPGEKQIEHGLWALAEQYTPHKHVAAYTQAMMDLGATVCTRSKPNCAYCPLRGQCQAYAQQTQAHYPSSKPKKTLPTKKVNMLLLLNNETVLLEKRPPSGIWGGLWSFPECPDLAALPAWCKQQFGYTLSHQQTWPVLRHTFSHFHLVITPIVCHVTRVNNRHMLKDASQHRWCSLDDVHNRGLASPIKRLLTELQRQSTPLPA